MARSYAKEMDEKLEQVAKVEKGVRLEMDEEEAMANGNI